jgi:hypothetical protein
MNGVRTAMVLLEQRSEYALLHSEEQATRLAVLFEDLLLAVSTLQCLRCADAIGFEMR